MSNNITALCQSYFGLTEAPFSIAPDPHYLFMSRGHREALATLLFGLSGNGGFVLLTGDVGAGKTTICRCLLEQVPEACNVAYIFDPKLTVVELLATICDEFGIAYPSGNSSIRLFVTLINIYLLDAHAKGRRAILIIDEAQNLAVEVLEQIRLLTNLETSKRKLLQIILLGQPELAAMLERPDLRQLAQRIVARYHLGPLTSAEVKPYVRHRLEVSGAQRQLFPGALMAKVYRLSRGVPRVINILCERALLGAYVQGKDRVDRAILMQAAHEVFPSRMASRRSRLIAVVTGLVLMAGSALVAALYQQGHEVAAEQAATSAKPTASGANTHASAQAKAMTALPATLAWPANLPRSSDRSLAYAALFKAWGAEYRAGADICRQAAGMGLSCRIGRGGLDELRYLNRPAILYLHDRQGQPFNATLTRLDADAATFVIGNEAIAVSLGALAQQWSGYYKLLWRSFPYANRSILAGDRGPAVAWLNRQLALAQGGVTATAQAPVFDDELMSQVKRFQLAQGLLPDGIAGPRTLTLLSAVADQAAPKLFHSNGDK